MAAGRASIAFILLVLPVLSESTDPGSPMPCGARLVALTVVTRHGDRSPLTPALSREFWRGTLPSSAELQELAAGTVVHRDPPEAGAPAAPRRAVHSAVGDGVFGTLTRRGVEQMRALGGSLRAELLAPRLLTAASRGCGVGPGGASAGAAERGFISAHLEPAQLALFSTDFPRTIQSLQALLSGLYPPGTRDDSSAPLVINASHTDRMLPQPEPAMPTPRQREARALEEAVRASATFAAKEAEMAPLADRVLRALLLSRALPSARALLAPDTANAPAVAPIDAHERAPHAGGPSMVAVGTQRVHWGRLAELVMCLREHGLLARLNAAARAAAALEPAAARPGSDGAAARRELESLAGWELRDVRGAARALGDASLGARADAPERDVGITDADVDAIVQHAAWRWFCVLRAPRIADLTMGPLVAELLVGAARAAAAAARDAAAEARARAAGGGAAAMAARAARAAACAAPSARGARGACERLRVYSAHDATIVGLLAAFRLGAPDHWPAYGALLRVEILADADVGGDDGGCSGFVVRFLLGGQPLPFLPGGPADGARATGVAHALPLDALLVWFGVKHEAEEAVDADMAADAERKPRTIDDVAPHAHALGEAPAGGRGAPGGVASARPGPEAGRDEL